MHDKNASPNLMRKSSCLLLQEDGSMNRVEVPRLLDLDPSGNPLSYKKEAEFAEKTSQKNSAFDRRLVQ